MTNRFQQYLEILVKRDIYTANGDSIEIEVYKNPQTLKNFGSWVRGIILRSGDIYVVDVMNVGVNIDNVFIHCDLTDWMNENIKGFKTDYSEGDDPMNYIGEFITVDRFEKTNTFVMAESYDSSDFREYEDDLMQYVAAFKRKNGQFELRINFDEAE